MNLDVIFSASEVTSAGVSGKTVVVIDVLRATSVMVTALNNGASRVIPVLSPEEAFEYKSSHDGEIILVGERNASAIEGFDYGNSPLDMVPSVVKDRTLVMTTTNGTRAIRAAKDASELFIASFLNSEATTRILKQTEDVVLIASGSGGSFTMEDTLCAGYMIELLNSFAGISLKLTDAAVAANQLFADVRDDLHKLAALGNHYRLLKSKGLDEDIRYCFLRDCIDLVCMRENGAIVSPKR
ncbi:MAG: 2-phosphosulfolactate phosphatase [Anaerophaga sp.]|nr:2-phosphosulfolactate phosphatase [Anaerophaga sp.]